MYAFEKAFVLLHGNLYNTVVIAKVNELYSSVIADILHPPRHADFFVETFFRNHFGGVCAVLVFSDHFYAVSFREKNCKILYNRCRTSLAS